MAANKTEECINCINTTVNPSITIGIDGLCNVCERYYENVDKTKLATELEFVTSFIQGREYDAMVGISGGKDSTATLYTLRQYGFSPLAFTFDIGYIANSVIPRARIAASKLGVDHEVINVSEYVRDTDKSSFAKMADLYDEEENSDLMAKFRRLYAEGREYYSTRYDRSFPFVRPCQVCRKIAVRAYYGEALRRGLSLVVIGINEWTGLSGGSYSAVRKLQPFPDKPPVYIVHLPFLLQRTLSDTKRILSEIGWEKPKKDKFIDANSNACLLARACEAKSRRMLGFHIDSTRLAREVTVGFITRRQAENALSHTRESRRSVREVLTEAGLI